MMQITMESSTFDEVFEIYIQRFGHTFTSLLMNEDKQEEVKKLMLQALEGKRGKITDKDLGIVLPEGAVI